MRTGAIAFIMLMASCGRPEAMNDAAAAPADDAVQSTRAELPEAAATVTLAATGPGGCAARWDGQPATPEQLLERSGMLVERAITNAGSIGNLTLEAIPSIAVEAPAGLSFACADRMLSAIRRSGLLRVLLKPQGSSEQAEMAHFTLSDIGAAPPSVAVVIGAGGRISWNEETLTPDALAERASRMGGGPGELPAPPGALELRPAREANFGQVYEALRTIRQGNVRAALLLPSVETRPRPGPPAANQLGAPPMPPGSGEAPQPVVQP